MAISCSLNYNILIAKNKRNKSDLHNLYDFHMLYYIYLYYTARVLKVCTAHDLFRYNIYIYIYVIVIRMFQVKK